MKIRTTLTDTQVSLLIYILKIFVSSKDSLPLEERILTHSWVYATWKTFLHQILFKKLSINTLLFLIHSIKKYQIIVRILSYYFVPGTLRDKVSLRFARILRTLISIVTGPSVPIFRPRLVINLQHTIFS